MVFFKEPPTFLSSERDRIYVIPLCDRCHRLWRAVGKPAELEPQQVKIV